MFAQGYRKAQRFQVRGIARCLAVGAGSIIIRVGKLGTGCTEGERISFLAAQPGFGKRGIVGTEGAPVALYAYAQFLPVARG